MKLEKAIQKFGKELDFDYKNSTYGVLDIVGKVAKVRNYLTNQIETIPMKTTISVNH